MTPKAEAACDDKAPKNVDAQVFAAIERFIGSWRTERNPSENTLRAYRIDLLDYARWAKRTRVDGLHPRHRQLRRYLSQLEQAQYSRATVNRRLSAVRTFFQWLNVNGIVSEDPASALSGPKQPQRLPHHLRPLDVAALLGVYGKRLDSQGRDERTPSEMRNQALLEFLYGRHIGGFGIIAFSAVDFDQANAVCSARGYERIVPLHDLALSSMRHASAVRAVSLAGMIRNVHTSFQRVAIKWATMRCARCSNRRLSQRAYHHHAARSASQPSPMTR